MIKLPFITCLCPTYGRVARLQQAISWFVSQTYEFKKLIICNDAPQEIYCEIPNVAIINCPRFKTLGHKRNFLLEMADTSVVAHWDDDDWYLPWHLETQVKQLISTNYAFVQPWKSFIINGVDPNWELIGPTSNRFDSNLVFQRSVVQSFGGYRLANVGQSRLILQQAKKQHQLLHYLPEAGPSMAARYKDGNTHCKDNGKYIGKVDFGSGELILTTDINPMINWIKKAVVGHLSHNMYTAFIQRCNEVFCGSTC